ncbi:MAG TPA: hypothetical protein VNP73_03670 [Actinomycetota bacterium]|nr:hypothetical protein [Actinomycetota bacterium]
MSPPAAGQTSREEIEVTTSKAAWYAQAPPCTAIDCSVVPLVSPYPEDTVHVAVSGGQETARTYVAFPIPIDDVVGGTLELPLDVDPANGSVSPETANFMACLAATKFEPVRGSFAEPPKTQCRVGKPARYDEKEVAFTVDLARFADHWKKAEAALALVPSAGAVEGGETWHVVFPAGEDQTQEPEEQQPAPEIVATLEYLSEDDPLGTDSTVDLGTDTTTDPSGSIVDLGSSSGPSFDDGTGFTGAQPSTEEVPDVSVPTELSAEEAAPVASFVEGFAGPGFAYPIVWALPLLLLVGLGAVGRALTKELYRRGM